MDQDAEGNPEEERERHHRAHDVISQEPAKRVDVQFVDEVPETLDHILDLLHALPLHTHTHTESEEWLRQQQDYQLEDTHRSITETHGARFAFPQEQEVTRSVLVGGADATAAAAAHFT